MKNLITLLTIFLWLGLASAQDKKPTKEETIEFLTNTLNQLNYDQGSKNGVIDKGIVKLVKFSDCKLYIEYYTRTNWKPLAPTNIEIYEKITIPIDKIEKINNDFSNTLNFHSYNNSDVIVLDKMYKDIEKNTIENKSSLQKTYSFIYENEDVLKKLIKAFNHLRKLCGAPEPISFD